MDDLVSKVNGLIRDSIMRPITHGPELPSCEAMSGVLSRAAGFDVEVTEVRREGEKIVVAYQAEHWSYHSRIAPPGLAGILAFLCWICCPSRELRLCRYCAHLTGFHSDGTCAHKGCACERCPHGWYQGNDCENCNPLPY